MEVKERIVQEACRFFLNEGVRRITMDEVARRLGMSKRTIYEHFRDKTELLHCCMLASFAQNDEEIAQLEGNCDHLLEFVLRILDYGSRSVKIINPAFFEDLRLYYPKLYNEMVAYRREEMVDQLRKLIEQGKKGGYFRSGTNAALVAKIFMEQMMAMNRRDVFPPELFSQAELFETLFLTTIRGISTRNGLQELDQLLNDYQKKQL